MTNVRILVCFQENAWCDKLVMIRRVRYQWKPYVEGFIMLYLDQCKAQKTPSIEGLLSSECNTTSMLIPPGCTSLLQPLDVVVNAPFKRLVNDLATSHMQEILMIMFMGIFLLSSKEYCLQPGYVGEAWEKICTNRDMVIREFRKCGNSVAIDGSEDDDINIKGLENYLVDNDDDDPFESKDDLFEDNSDTAPSIDDEGTLDSNFILAGSKVPDDSITLSEIFLQTSCEFVPIDVENIILNLPVASDFMKIPQYDKE